MEGLIFGILRYMEVYNFPFSCKNQKEYKAYLRCFPTADGLCEVNDQTGGGASCRCGLLFSLLQCYIHLNRCKLKRFYYF